eukprot:snap_masked-scaffold_2-processed-gene-10.16-mRNA-1 protein AED:1.00 eAED:1.00 QI:0/0/0/0/1/1/2/0/787
MLLNCIEDVEAKETVLYATDISQKRVTLLILISVVLLYSCRMISVLVNQTLIPAFNVLAEKLKISSNIKNAVWIHLPHILPNSYITFFSLIQTKAQTLIKHNKTFSTTGFGLFFGTIILKAFIIPSIILLKNSFICIFLTKKQGREFVKVNWVIFSRDLFVFFVTCVLYTRMLLSSDSAIIQLNQKMQENLCLSGNEGTCCYQSIQDQDTYSRVQSNLVTPSDCTALMILMLFYFGYLLANEKLSLLLKQISKVSKNRDHLNELQNWLNSKKKEEEAHSNHLVHENLFKLILRGNERLMTLSIIFVTRCRFPADEMFSLIDVDDNKTLDNFEFVKMFRVFGIEISETTALDLVKFIDVSNVKEGRIGKESFINWFNYVEGYLIDQANILFTLLKVNFTSKDPNNQRVKASDAIFWLNFCIVKNGLTKSSHIPFHTMALLYITPDEKITKIEFFLWFRACTLFLQFSDKLVKNDSTLGAVKSNFRFDVANFCRYVDQFVHDLALYDIGNTKSPKLDIRTRLMYEARAKLPSKQQVEGFSVLPFSSAFAYESVYTYSCLFYYLSILSKLLDAPILFIFHLFAVSQTGKLHSLSALGAVWWIIIGSSLLMLLSLLVIYTSETLSISLDLPLEAISFGILPFAIHYQHILDVLGTVDMSGNTLYLFKQVLSRSYSPVLLHSLMGMPAALYFALMVHQYSSFSEQKQYPLVFDSEAFSFAAIMFTSCSLFNLLYLVISNGKLGLTYAIFQGLICSVIFVSFLLLANTDISRGTNIQLVCANCIPDLTCVFES